MQAGQVVAQPLGVEPRRRDHEQRRAFGECGQRRRDHRLGRFGNGHGRVGGADQAARTGSLRSSRGTAARLPEPTWREGATRAGFVGRFVIDQVGSE